MAENVTPVVLKVKDFQDREVMMVDYKFVQATDVEGQIAGLPRGGRIDVKVKALNDGNNQLIQWMLGEYDARDMKIVIENTVEGKTMKTIEGTGCYCVHFEEKWEDKEEHYEEVTITCQKLKVGPAEFDNSWK